MGWAASSGNALLITTSSIYFYQRDVFLLGLFDALCLSARLLKKLWMNLNISGKERTWHKKQSIRSWVRGRGVIWIRIQGFVFTFFYIGKVPYTMHDTVRALKNWRIATLVFHTEQNRPARTKYENRLAQIMRVVPSPWGHLPGVVVVIIISRDPIKLCTCSRVISSQPSLRRILMAFRSHNRCYSVQRSIDFLCAAQ